MREDLRDRLARSFSSSGEPVRSSGVAAIDLPPDQDRFVQSFLRKAERIVYPAMMEIGRVVEQHGRFFSIEYIRERETCRGNVLPTSVQMNFFRRLRTTNYRNENPHFNVNCDRAGHRVVFSYAATAGEPPRACGSCSLEQLSRDLVQDRIATTLEAVLKA